MSPVCSHCLHHLYLVLMRHLWTRCYWL
uniref:Uncharacterized protein n=1 Tax=Anguilla anguilla TaxID=7936 RepID=A0A0E9UTH5_ANGAN